MRANATEGSLLLDDSSERAYEKFLAFAAAMPFAVGNPIYHWSHLELKRYFGIDETLSERTAPGIWEQANAKIAAGLRPRDFIKMSNVEVICTTDDPADSLEDHMALKGMDLGFRVLPTWRPDKILQLRAPDYPSYISGLAASAGVEINSLDELKGAILHRLEHFMAAGCCISDHSLDYVPCRTGADPAAAFAAALDGRNVTLEEESAFAYHIMCFMGAEYRRRGMAMQLHIGALRGNNTRMRWIAGANAGFDSVNDFAFAEKLAALLDELESAGGLPKTILYHVNPAANYVLGSMIGNFQGRSPGMMQFGAAWWFCDHFDGLRRQLTDLAALGLLGRFVGMLTDSRCFLSYARHEYFRRVLCGLLGEWMEAGHLPNSVEPFGQLVEGICYRNAKQYFGF
jgi:glucuronate isomerase